MYLLRETENDRMTDKMYQFGDMEDDRMPDKMQYLFREIENDRMTVKMYQRMTKWVITGFSSQIRLLTA